MSISHLLQDFYDDVTPVTGDVEANVPSSRTSSIFEEGYKAGWDDALKAEASNKEAISANLSRNLQDLTFTFVEAKSAAFAEFEELIEIVLEKVLPEAAHETLGQHLANSLKEQAESLVAAEISIVTNLQDVEVVNRVISDIAGVASFAKTDPDLPPGTVSWSIAGSEKTVDVDQLVLAIQEAVRGFVFEERGLKHA